VSLPARLLHSSRHGGLHILPLFRFYLFIFSDSCQINYLKVYRSDLHEMFRVAKIMAVNDQFEIIIFFDLSPDATMTTNFCWYYSHSFGDIR